jgi:uncharacterized protein
MSYWDTSCLVKLYAAESDSPLMESHALESAQMVTSEIARFELWTTLRRKEADGQLSQGAALALFQIFLADVAKGDITLFPTDDTVRREFEAIVDRCHGCVPPLPLRTLDAIHLATAHVTKAAEMVATDKRLRDAAVFEGFCVFPRP